MSSTRSLHYARRLAGALVVVVLAACSAPGAGSPGATGALATLPALPSIALPSLPAVTLPPVPSGVSAGTAQVDLTFTGTYPFTAKGTVGRCAVAVVGGATAFAFEGTEADYPGLGASFSVAELSGRVDIKWVKDADTSWGIPPSAVIQATPDHHGVTLDVELSPFTNTASGKTAGPEHVKGTITCP